MRFFHEKKRRLFTLWAQGCSHRYARCQQASIYLPFNLCYSLGLGQSFRFLQAETRNVFFLSLLLVRHAVRGRLAHSACCLHLWSAYAAIGATFFGMRLLNFSQSWLSAGSVPI